MHKLAPVGSTYRFCVLNHDPSVRMEYEISIGSGLSVGELHLLPDSSDTDSMVLQMQWIQQEAHNLRSTLGKLNGMRSRTEAVSSLMSSKLIMAVVTFTLAVIAVNCFFYIKMRRTLQARKMI